MLKRIDEWGSPLTYPHMAAGWAVAFDAPFTWTKQVASSFGGTRNGMAIRWPKGFKARNEVRSQFHHVIDVAPTILEAAGLPEGMVGMQENVFLNVKNKSMKITADVEVPAGGANGTIIAQGGRFGGWSLYVQGGKPAYDYNFLGLERWTIASAQALPPGKATIVFDFAYDGGGVAKGGTGTLSVNGKQVAQGRIERTQPAVFSVDDTADVGIDLATPVVESVGAEKKSRFTGRIPKLVLEIRDANPQAEAAAERGRQDVARKSE